MRDEDIGLAQDLPLVRPVRDGHVRPLERRRLICADRSPAKADQRPDIRALREQVDQSVEAGQSLRREVPPDDRPERHIHPGQPQLAVDKEADVPPSLSSATRVPPCGSDP